MLLIGCNSILVNGSFMEIWKSHWWPGRKMARILRAYYHHGPKSMIFLGEIIDNFFVDMDQNVLRKKEL